MVKTRNNEYSSPIEARHQFQEEQVEDDTSESESRVDLDDDDDDDDSSSHEVEHVETHTLDNIINQKEEKAREDGRFFDLCSPEPKKGKDGDEDDRNDNDSNDHRFNESRSNDVKLSLSYTVISPSAPATLSFCPNASTSAKQATSSGSSMRSLPVTMIARGHILENPHPLHSLPVTTTSTSCTRSSQRKSTPHTQETSAAHAFVVIVALMIPFIFFFGWKG